MERTRGEACSSEAEAAKDGREIVKRPGFIGPARHDDELEPGGGVVMEDKGGEVKARSCSVNAAK